MGSYMKEKLDELRKKLKTPPKLSDTEKEKFTEIFEGLQLVLKETLEAVLDMDKDDAYKYLNLLVAGLQKVDVDYEAGVEAKLAINEEKGPIESPESNGLPEKARPTGPVVKPDFISFTKDLTQHQLDLGYRVLDCFKQFEEVGDDIVCPDCSLERMVACIRAVDPTINPADDIIKEVDEARRAGKIPP